jgi:flagellar motility protein MotE (MotC chaperone)/CBS domain-containing protein/sporulation protein YlmC with PRC-barrel domain
MEHRVFLARLAGTAVFDPNGDQVGRVRDAVLSRPAPLRLPRVRGLVVEVPPKRRIFVPMGRITDISDDQVVTTGTLNLRRFQLHADEVLALGQLRNSNFNVKSKPNSQKIVDMAMQLDQKAREWSITTVFVRESSSGFMRRAVETLIDWSELQIESQLATASEEQQLLAQVNEMHEADAAKFLLTLSYEVRLQIARDLADEVLAAVLEELPDDDRVALLQGLELSRAANILEEMDPADAADVLSEMSPESAAAYLNLMEPTDAAGLKQLLTYGDYTAGGMMTSNPVILPANATVADALAAVRVKAVTPALAAQVFVVRAPTETPTGRFLGIAHTQRLLREPPFTLVSSVLDTTIEAIHPAAPLSDVTRRFATYNLVALPVIDEVGRLIGAVTADDLIDHMLPSDWRDQPEVENG